MKPNIKTLLKSYGLVSSRKIQKVLEDVTRTFMNCETLTFAELYKYNPIKFYVTATCVDLHVTHYFSIDTTPQMSVFEALCMTVSIPFLFQSVRHGPWHYVDGGALEAVPCGMLVGEDPKSVLAFSVDEEWTPMDGIKDIKAYAISMIGAAMTLRHAYPQIPRIKINPGPIDTFDFSASNDAKFRLFIRGYTTTKKSLCRVNGNDPACCIHAPLEAEADKRSFDPASQGVQLRASSIDGASQVHHDQEPGKTRKGTEDPASSTHGYADDVRLLDSIFPRIPP
jgi:predicted acylesterase/phospholipase RssA